MPKHRVLVVDDDKPWCDVLANYLTSQGCEVTSAGSCSEVEYMWHRIRPDVAVLDYSLPDGDALQLLSRLKASDPSITTIVLTGYGSIDLAVEAVKLGATQFLTKPVELSALWVMIRDCIENKRRQQNELAERNKEGREPIDPFLGRSSVIQELQQRAVKVAAVDSPVLIQGETGSGKGVLAHWIHGHSPRAGEPFLDLNCGGLSRELLETELFGHEKGAFTGAIQSKPGLLEIAHKGTVFLDEIGDVDLAIQPKLLKVLEEKQFRRLGDVKDRRVDVRLIAATHQDMTQMVRDHQFRSDLYFRISAIPLMIPPLSKRPEDVPILAQFFICKLAKELSAGNVQLSDDAVNALQSYSWPGNIRELKNVLERAILLRAGQILTDKDLHFDIQSEPEISDRGPVQTLEQMEKRYIEEVLMMEGGRVRAAALKLGIPRSSLYHKIRQYGIYRPGTLSLIH